MAVKVGIDSRGRHYKTVNGRRVKAVEDDGGEKREAASQDIHALRNPIRNALKRMLHGGGDRISHSISQVLQSRFNELMSTTAKTAVGKYGQLYAARYLLAALRANKFEEPTEADDKELKKFVHKGALDTAAFRQHLVDQGVDAPEPEETKAHEVAAPNEDAAILAFVHQNNLTLADLRDKFKSSNP